MTIDERLEKLTARLEALTQTVQLQAEKQNREAAAFRQDLRRAVRLGVAEARNHRRRLHTLDDYMTKLAAAQLVTEEKVTAIGLKLEGLIDALRRGGNGKP